MKRKLLIAGVLVCFSVPALAQQPQSVVIQSPEGMKRYDIQVKPQGPTQTQVNVYDWQQGQFKNYQVQKPDPVGNTTVWDWQKGGFSNYQVRPVGNPTGNTGTYNVYDWQTGKFSTVTVQK